MSRLQCLLILLLAAGCSPNPGEPEAVDPLDWALDEPGPYAVGYTSWEITYQGLGDGVERSLPLHLWYPTEDRVGTPATYEFIFEDEGSWLDATPAEAAHEIGYPVLAISHGNQGFGGSTAFLSRVRLRADEQKRRRRRVLAGLAHPSLNRLKRRRLVHVIVIDTLPDPCEGLHRFEVNSVSNYFLAV